MKTIRLSRLTSLLAGLVLIAAWATGVFIPLSAADWNEVLSMDASLSGWLVFLPEGSESNCTHPRAYWLDHPDTWPLSELTLAGLPKTKEEALQLLKIDPESSVQQILIAELISAYLNRAQGADPRLLDPLIDEAEAILTLSGVPEARMYLEDDHTALVAKALAAYNEGQVGPGCCPVKQPTPTPSASPTVQETPSPTSTIPPTEEATLTDEPTQTPTPTASPTVTATPTPTDTAEPDVSPDPSPSATVTPSPTFTPSPTATMDPANNCTLPLAYWREHPDQWPVDRLRLGGVEITRAEAMALLEKPNFDPVIRLVKALIVVKLNVAHGSDPAAVNIVMRLADDWLTLHPLGGLFDEELFRQAEAMTRDLETYNEGGMQPGLCEIAITPTVTNTPGVTQEATTEPTPALPPTETVDPEPLPTDTVEVLGTATPEPGETATDTTAP
ncbi:MAG: hypothetical protein HY835_03720 [Anaerolineae bacterium]|nr:hypothetical protein [Anaerolineae bacterium]